MRGVNPSSLAPRPGSDWGVTSQKGVLVALTACPYCHGPLAQGEYWFCSACTQRDAEEASVWYAYCELCKERLGPQEQVVHERCGQWAWAEACLDAGLEITRTLRALGASQFGEFWTDDWRWMDPYEFVEWCLWQDETDD
jgi:hypothetical protein